MYNVAKVLNTFWNSFGIPAYIEENLPNDVQLPYITYTLSQPEWKDTTTLQARVWYKGTGFSQLVEKVDEISRIIGEGYSVQTEDKNGCVVLFKDINFAQIQPFTDESQLKVAYLNLIMHAYTN